MRIEQGGVGYEDDGCVLRNVDLRVARGDRVALVGYNGMGKTTLLRALAGVLPLREGRRVVGHKVVIGYQSQDFVDTMAPERSVLDTVRQAAGGAGGKDIRTLLGAFGFSGDDIEKRCGVLSGGEKIRLAFARLFVNPPNLLLLDEPTTHLDLNGRRTLEQALRDYAGTFVLVSHDVTFVRSVATTVIAMEPPGIRKYWGGYDYYREKLEQQAGPENPAAAGVVADAASDRVSAKERRRRRAQQRAELNRRVGGLRREIQRLEEQVSLFSAERDRLAAELAAPGADVDFARASRRLKTIEEEIAARTRRWESLAEELESAESEADMPA
jgi:ATP-binding cassette subfamily F protein 3